MSESRSSDSSEKLGADLKIIIIGNSATGKTSIINRFINGSFDESYKATIASEFSYKIITKDEIIYRLQFWDLAGQDRGGEVTKIFARDSHGVIFVCSCEDKQTREDITIWKKSIEDAINTENVPMILMENKSDLLSSEEKARSIESLKEFTKKHGLVDGFLTSAKEGVGIEEAMKKLIDSVIANNKNEIQSFKSTTESRGSELSKKKTEKKDGCCG